MSIQKKSLINTLKSAKKANVVKDEVTVSGATVSASKAAPVKVLRTASPVKVLRTASPVKVLRTASPVKVLKKAAPVKVLRSVK